MPDMPNFNMQNNFPISSVIDAASRNAALQQQALQAGNQSLVQGLQAIGGIGSSLLARRQQMAQALAGAHLLAAQDPNIKAAISPTTTTTTTQAPVMQNQTAAYDPTTGSVTPNTDATGVATTRPQTESTVTPPTLDMNTLATSLMGESPSNMLTQLFDRQKQQQQLNIEQRKQALAEQIEPQKLTLDNQLKTLMAQTAIKNSATEATKVGNEDVNSLLQRRAEATKDLPTGWWNSIGNDKADAAKQQIAGIDAQLKAKGYKGDGTVANGQFSTPSGTSYTVNP